MKTPTYAKCSETAVHPAQKGCDIKKLSQHQLETMRAILQVLFW